MAHIITLKAKVKLEQENSSLVSTKLQQEINKNATKNTINELEVNDPLGKFGNYSSHFSINIHTLLGKSSKMLVLLLLAYYNFHQSRPIGQNNYSCPIVASHMSYSI